MGGESSDVVRFDLGPLLQGQTMIAKLKSAYNLLILALEVCNVKPTSLVAISLLKPNFGASPT